VTDVGCIGPRSADGYFRVEPAAAGLDFFFVEFWNGGLNFQAGNDRQAILVFAPDICLYDFYWYHVLELFRKDKYQVSNSMDIDPKILKLTSRKLAEAIPPTILEENTISDASTAEVLESPKDSGLLRQTNIAVDQFRKVIQEHEVALSRICRSVYTAKYCYMQTP
jgi:hypothetical protein